MSKGGRYLNSPQNSPKEPGRKSGKGTKIALIIVAVILVLLISLFVGLWSVYKSIIGARTQVQTVRPTLPTATTAPKEDASSKDANKGSTETEPTEPDYGKTGKVVNILVIGQAGRDGEDAKISDTIILATINKETSTVTMTSFLRDTYIQLATPYKDTKGRTHKCGHQKINMAYALGYSWGGAADAMMFLDQTLTNNFQIEIDYNVEVNFDAFEKGIELLGGVDVDLTAEEAAYMRNVYKKYEFSKDWECNEGPNHLGGWTALVYARMRHSSPADSDIKRANRQRMVINQLLKKCATKSIPELTSIAKELMPYLTTDMTDGEITTLMVELIPLLAKLNFESNQIPAEGTYWSQSYEESGNTLYALAFDVGKNAKIMQAIAEADHQ